MPRIWDGQNELMLARLGQDDLKRVSDSLPENFADNRLHRQIQVALAAYQAGLSVSVSVSAGGFDTHGNHDNNHLPNLIDFVNGANFAMQEAERMGIADKVAVVMGSDFGRTPGYNSGNGKDHWPISSMMMMGPGIPGNRVIGGTDERHGLQLIDPVTLQATGSPDTATGTRLSIAHVHRALRNLAGVPDNYKAAFPLPNLARVEREAIGVVDVDVDPNRAKRPVPTESQIGLDGQLRLLLVELRYQHEAETGANSKPVRRLVAHHGRHLHDEIGLGGPRVLVVELDQSARVEVGAPKETARLAAFEGDRDDHAHRVWIPEPEHRVTA
ncbi:MAG: DUF1501 domain-containing protein [Deltaproteobacteria bacterium]|nr:DUF1501 domain-containing protein [Deltaproteobacteria bacterium]